MNAWGSSAMPRYGKSSLSFLTTCPWRLLLKTKSSVSTVVSRQVSTLWTRFASSIECRRRPTRVPSATCSGQILMIGAAGASHPEVLATPSARTSPSNSTTPTTWLELRVRISWSWTGTTGRMSVTLWPFSPHPTTATDAATRPPSWRWTSSWSITCK